MTGNTTQPEMETLRENLASESAHAQETGAQVIEHPMILRMRSLMAANARRRVAQMLKAIFGRPNFLIRLFDDMAQLARQYNYVEVFKDTIFASISVKAHSLDVVLKFCAFARNEGFFDALLHHISSQPDPDLRTKISFKQISRKSLTSSTDLSFEDFLCVKYAHIPLANDWCALEQSALELAPQVFYPAGFAEQLFSRRQDKEATYADWQHKLRFATALEHLARECHDNESRSNILHPDTEALLQPYTQSGRPVVFVFAHVGFSAPRRALVRGFLKEALVISKETINNGSSAPPYAWGKNDVRTALFCCLRALASSGSVVVSPDGQVGGKMSSVNVLGGQISVATGPIFIAHETKADVAWIHMEFNNGGFTPVIVEGPRSLPGEKYEVYEKRFLKFYGDAISRLLSGSPHNIVLNRYNDYTRAIMSS